MRADLAARIPAPGSAPRSRRSWPWRSAARETCGAGAKTDPQDGRLRNPAGQRGGLLHPRRHLRLVELVVLMDVEVAHFLVLGLAGGDRTERRAAEESHLDVLREAMEAEEPALALDAVKWRVPLDGLAHV